MSCRIGVGIGVAVWVGLFAALVAVQPVAAQPVRNRILDGLSVRDEEPGWSVSIAFTNPVRYLRHAPNDRGRSVHIQLENIRVGPVDLVPSFGRESLQAPRGSSVPLVEVVYDGSGAEGPVLDLRFSRDVEFSIRQGEDFRSIRIELRDPSRRVAPPAPPQPPPRPTPETEVLPSQARRLDGPPEVAVDLDDPFALELDAVPREGTFAPLPGLAVFRQNRVYVLETTRQGKPWKSRRLGFFPDADSAKQTALLLAPYFPEAVVIEVSRSERLVSEAAAVSPPQRTGTAVQPAPQTATANDEQTEAVRALVEQARDVLTAGDLEAAIRLLTKASTYPPSRYAPDVLELLGVARERNGQLAHAKAQYQKYLASYPEGEGAQRVSQRLQALVSRRAEPREDLRPARSSAEEWDLRTYGSVSSTYFRSELFRDTSEDFADDTGIADVNFVARLRRGDIDIESRLASDYRIDNPFQQLDDSLRLSTLYVEASDRGLGLDGSLGRQSINAGGVLGRFDGGGLGVTFLDGWRIGSVAGFPVDYDRHLSVDTDRRFVGVSLESPRLFEAVNGQIWALGQQIGGRIDREAVGAELRYVGDGRFAAVFVDYDVHFTELNSALLVANATLGWDTEANLYLDYRYTPPLLTSNALIGQPVSSVDDLKQLYSSSEIEELARDRTARSATGTLSLTKHLTEQLQLTADGTLSEVDDLPESGNVPAIEGTGLEYQVGLQVLANSLLTEGDIAVASVRYFDGNFSDNYGGSLNLRFPAAWNLRLNPRLDADYRAIASADDALFVRPALRIDLEFWKLTIDAEAGFEWVRRFGGDGGGDEYGYLTRLGIRVDFD